MAKPQCPLPQVEDALAPFIHTREKTTRIRQILTHHLKRQVQDESEPTHLSLSLPPSSLNLSDITLPTEGLYTQYLQALKAHRQARERYDTIKVDLDQLVRADPGREYNESYSSSTASVLEYANLLRQRRQKRKLEIVQDALTKLLEIEPHLAHADIKSSVKEELGEPPQPPVGGLDGTGDADSRVEDLTFQLKKELLVAKNKFAEAKSAKIEAGNRASSSNEVDFRENILILRNARDEMIAWIEGELAKIPEDEIEASQAEISFIAEDNEVNGAYEQLSNEQISGRVDESYSQYVMSRQHYISEVEAALERGRKLGEPIPEGARTQAPLQSPRRLTVSASDSKTSSIQALQLLPYLTSIASTTKEEALVQQQTSHLRRQLLLASDETDNVVQRLAGESLLVPQNSISVSAWAKTAKEANERTKEAVLEQVKDGEESMGKAKMVLESLRARKKALESLKRDL